MDQQEGRRWFKQDGGRFQAAFDCAERDRAEFESLTSELVDYRLAQYASTRLAKSEGESPERFIAKVFHSGGRPILKLPSVEEVPGRPIGPVEAKLPDGSIWVFRCVRIACNVAGPKGTDRNQLGELMRRWFGPDAGVPGTGFKVTFTHSADGWSVAPADATSASVTPTVLAKPVVQNVIELVAAPEIAERYSRFVPVYTLEAAAGLWGPEMEPEQAGWTDASKFRPGPGMFVIKVRGRSMEPKIPDSSWCVFRKCPPGSREGKIVLIQFHSLGNVESGGRFTAKKYHSEKIATEDSWIHQRIQLLPLNPDYQPIEVEPQEAEQMIVVGEFVGVL